MRPAPAPAPTLALALALGLMAGCVATPPEAGPQPGESGEVHAFFTKEMALVAEAPGEEAAVASGSFFQAWAAGRDYPTWRAPTATRDVAIEAVVVDLAVRATGPVVRTFRFPDLMVYAGSGDAWMGINTTQTAPVLVPGTVYTFRLEIPVPGGGLWVPAGAAFGLKVVPVMHQNDQADVEILVGTPEASRASWRETPVAPPVVATWTRGQDAGELAGSEYAGAAAPATARHRTVVEVAAADATNATGVVLAWMNTTSNEGVPDLDLEIVSPQGESLAFAGTPTPREMLRLAPFNLAGPGEYTLVAHNYGSARARFTLEWAVG